MSKRNVPQVISSTSRILVPLTFASGLANQIIAPQLMGTRITTLSSLYRYFRMKKIKVILPPGGKDVSTGLIERGILATFVPGSGHTAPINLTDVESNYVEAVAPGERVRHELVLDHSALHPMVPWYISEGVGTDANLESCGTIYFFSLSNSNGHGYSMLTTDSASFTVMLEITVEFKDPMDPDVTALVSRISQPSTDCRGNCASRQRSFGRW